MWTIFWLIAAGIFIGVLSLRFAFGTYSLKIFKSYFGNRWILFLNLAPVFLLLLFFYFLYGRLRAAYITTSAVVIGLSFANYYLLRFRDSALMFEDLLNIREGVSIAAKQKYDLTPDKPMILGIIGVLLGVFLISVFAKHRMKIKFGKRLLLALIPVIFMALLWNTLCDKNVYTGKAQNSQYINPLAETQVYVSKGFVYPFLHSITANSVKKPDGYSDSEAKTMLSAYQDADIPKDQKVSVVTIQLEAFCDLSKTEAEGLDWDKAYGTYHEILDESYHGRLITNIFAGGTINTERCFLTGFTQLSTFHTKTNSYAWYFQSQGYSVSGSHPCYDWFYDRKNINGYLGFPDYYFYENHYSDLAGGNIAADNILMPEIYSLYEKAHQSGDPVFSFNVTYQGHGPYDTKEVWRGKHYTDGSLSTASANILDNYLGSVEDSAQQLKKLLSQFESSGDPVVVVFYGDHKPWLGNGNSVYQELGISLDTSTEGGFLNKYTTDYGIWATSSAKKILGNDFSGEGPDLSSNFLMNEVFDLCSWKGNTWMQATESVRETLPVITTVEWDSDQGKLTKEKELSKTASTALATYNTLQYYWQKNFSGK